MSIEILTGLPGSGKSERLIAKVQSARSDGITAITICCSESLILQSQRNIKQNQLISSRSGLFAELDRFESTAGAIQFLGTAKSDWLIAFEEAQHFQLDIVDAWCDASNRGVSIIIAAPNRDQLALLLGRGYVCTNLTLNCQKCRNKVATTFFSYREENRTVSVCDACYCKMKDIAEKHIVSQLVMNEPHPKKKFIYQPVELPICKTWEVIRKDSILRFELIKDAFSRVGLPACQSNYLDIGCNTGFFCYKMSRAGFKSTGVDVVKNDINLARLLSTYYRRDYVDYITADAYEYLDQTQHVQFDIASAFSVFQWIMIQKSAKHGLDCMNWLFQKCKYICVLEMGESTEDHYIERIGMKYDSEWIHSFMKASGKFDIVEVYDAAQYGLKRDLFIGFTPAGKMRMLEIEAE